jgi:hypothetical protein
LLQELGMKKRKRHVWAGLKKGDPCLVVSCIGESREHVSRGWHVKTVGRYYITVESERTTQRFDIETGCGEYSQSLQTKKTYAEYIERRGLLIEIRRMVWNRFPTEVLRQVAALYEGGA